MRTPIKNLKKQTNSLSEIKKIIPKGSVIQTYPFYDGAVEFSLAESERYTIGCTKSRVVNEFWTYTMKEPKRVSEIASKMFPILNENTFDLLKMNWHSYKDPFVRSALFFLLNSCSSLGMISQGELDVKNYNPFSINELRTFQVENFSLILLNEQDDYKTLKNVDVNLFHGGKFYYDILNTEQLIGLEESPFKHTKFLENFKDTPSVFIYEYHPRLSKQKGYSKIYLDQYGRETNESNAKEIILHNV